MALESSSIRSRLGFFGGSFDPPHLGHIELAKQAVIDAKLDTLLLCPAFHAPMRDQAPHFSARDRLGMIESICRNHKNFVPCSLEVDHQSTRFTYETLCEVRKEYPLHDLFLLLGDDQFNKLEQWENPSELAKLVHFLVFYRGKASSNPPNLPNLKFTTIKNRPINISSTAIRKQLSVGHVPVQYLPAEVSNYLTQNCQ